MNLGIKQGTEVTISDIRPRWRELYRRQDLGEKGIDEVLIRLLIDLARYEKIAEDERNSQKS